MRLIDNINSLLGEDLKGTLKPGSKLKIAASCFSIYAYVVLKRELESIDSLEFIFTSPTFVPNEASDKMKKEQREFHIPKTERERSLTGSEFEIQLKNQLTQKAIARECADWIRRKAIFRSNRGQAPMKPACTGKSSSTARWRSMPSCGRSVPTWTIWLETVEAAVPPAPTFFRRETVNSQ